MKKSSLWLLIVSTSVCLLACQSTPDTVSDSSVVDSTEQALAQVEADEVVEESAAPEREDTKPVMWVYKNNDTWSQVLTNAALDIRGEESDSSRCQGAANIQYVGQCLNWNLIVSCETEGERWFYGESAPINGSICRSKNGEWSLKTPQHFQQHGTCNLQVDEAADQDLNTFSIDCSWLSEDRMTKGASSFSFEPMTE